jgi:Zn-dependent protease with chaperone function
MATGSAPTSPLPRLNPFAFPSDTDFRFVLLIVLVLGSSMFAYNWIFNSLPANRVATVETYERCSPLGVQDPGAALRSLGRLSADSQADQTTFTAATQAYAECVAPYNEALADWIIGGVFIVSIVALGLYLALPQWKMRRGQYTALVAADVPDLPAYLSELCLEIGVTPAPSFVWNPLQQVPTGVAFGRRGRRYVGMTGGLVRLSYRDRPLFRAVMLHELAHLRNADIDKTYLAVATTCAFVVAAALPFALTLIGEPWALVWDLGWRFAILSALVYLTFAGVLRARELYADVRASAWDLPNGKLEEVLRKLPPEREGWRESLQFHPDPGQRIDTVAHPDLLFHLGIWEPFATGLAIAIALPNIQNVVSLLATRTQQSVLAPLVSAALFAVLIVGIVGLGIWRSGFTSQIQGHPPISTARFAVALVAGMVLGQPISFRSVITLGEGPGQFVGAFLFQLVWSALALPGFLLFFRWIAVVARAWFPVSMQGRHPRASYTAPLVVATLVLTTWLGVLFFVLGFADVIPTSLPAEQVLALTLGFVLGTPIVVWWLLPNLLTLVAAVSLWAAPLAAGLWSRRAIDPGPARWVFLDVAPGDMTLEPAGGLRPGTAIRGGLFGGLIFCLLLLVIRSVARAVLPDEVRGSDEFRLGFFVSQVALAAVIAAATAAIVASKIRTLGTSHGLLGAFSGSCLMWIGLLGLNLLFGGTLDPSFAWQTFWSIVAGGALITVPAALVGSGRPYLAARAAQQEAPVPSASR